MGTRLGMSRFEILELIGEGASGRVYRARDLQLNRLVALKVLRDIHAQNPLARERFEREARLAASINHQNLVAVHDLEIGDHCQFIVMDLISGKTLRDAILESTPTQLLITYLRDAGRGLAKAHREGIIHRDMKPDNILITEDGIPKIADFGLARDLATATQLTQTGSIVGTPSYMAPEQTGSGKASAATDVYAMGAILSEIITGRRPFSEHGPDSIYTAIRSGDLPLRGSDVTQELRPLVAVVLKSMAKEPRRRYRDAAAFVEELDRFLSFGEVKAKEVPYAVRKFKQRLRVITGSLIILAIVTLSIIFLTDWAFQSGKTESYRDINQSAQLVFRAESLIAESRDSRGTVPSSELQTKLAVADRLADEAIVKHKKSAPAYYAKAKICRLNGAFDQALAYLDHAIELDQDLKPAHFEKGRLLYEKAFLLRLGFSPVDTFERNAESLILIEEANKEVALGFEQESSVTASPKAIVQQIFALVGDDKKNDARALAKTSALQFEGRPEEADFYWLLGLLSSHSDRLWYLEKTLELDPNNPIAQFALATTLHHGGLMEKAAESYRRTLELTPSFRAPHLRLALIHLDANQFEEALKELARIPDGDVFHADREFMSGNVFVARSFVEPMQRRKHLKRSLSYFDAAVKINPDYVGALCNRGNAQAEFGDYENAERDYDRAIALSSENPLCRTIRATYYFRVGRKKEAIKELTIALTKEPENDSFLAERGMFYAEVGKEDLALQDLDAALDLNPKNLPALMGRGTILMQQGDYTQALADFEDAIREDKTAGLALAGQILMLKRRIK